MPDPSPPVELVAAGQRFAAWTEVSATLSLAAASGEFSFAVSDEQPVAFDQRRIRNGDPCSISIYDQTVITGFVDRFRPSYDANGHVLKYGGRDAPADLVDCAAVHVPGEWKGLDALRLASIIAKPFGVKVRAEVPVGAVFASFRIQESERAFGAIERIARNRGLLVTTDGLGSIVLTRSSAATRKAATLQLGANILAGAAEYSTRDRFSTVTVKGQRQATDFDFGPGPASAKATARDPGINRYRPHVILAEAQGVPGELTSRARLDVARRSALGRSATLTVKDWRDDAGDVWRPNTLVQVHDEWLEIDRELLVVTVRYLDDAQGVRSELSLAPPEAFDVAVIPEKESDNLWTTSG